MAIARKKTPQVEPIEGVTPLGLSEQPVEAPAPVTESNEAAEEHAEPVPAVEATREPNKTVRKTQARQARQAAKPSVEVGPRGCTGRQQDGSVCKMPASKEVGLCFNHQRAAGVGPSKRKLTFTEGESKEVTIRLGKTPQTVTLTVNADGELTLVTA